MPRYSTIRTKRLFLRSAPVSVSAGQLNSLAGITGNVQNQINLKSNKLNPSFTGVVSLPNNAIDNTTNDRWKVNAQVFQFGTGTNETIITGAGDNNIMLKPDVGGSIELIHGANGDINIYPIGSGKIKSTGPLKISNIEGNNALEIKTTTDDLTLKIDSAGTGDRIRLNNKVEFADDINLATGKTISINSVDISDAATANTNWRGSVTSTEVGRLSGLDGPIMTKLAEKLDGTNPVISGVTLIKNESGTNIARFVIDGTDFDFQVLNSALTFKTGDVLRMKIDDDDISIPSNTASRVLISDANKNIKTSSVTTTTLGYLDATGPIQAQLDAKATSASITTAIDNLIDSAPGALNTLNELAAAIGDDSNYAGTITTALAAKSNIASPTFTGTVGGITKTMVGLGNVDNVADASKPVSTAQQTALDAKHPTINSGARLNANLIGANGNVSNTEFGYLANVSSDIQTQIDAASGGAGLTFNPPSSNNANPSTSAQILSALNAKEDSLTFGIANTNAIKATAADIANGEYARFNATGLESRTLAEIKSDLTLVKGDVGLGNVDNVADASKPVSTAQQTALNLKANIAGPTFTGTVQGITKAMVGLTDVDDTADSAKPVSTAQQTALDLKFDKTGGAVSGNIDIENGSGDAIFSMKRTGFQKFYLKSHSDGYLGIGVDGGANNGLKIKIKDDAEVEFYGSVDIPSGDTYKINGTSLAKGDVGLGNVDNTTDAGKPVSTATQTALDLKANLASPALTGNPTAPTQSSDDNSTKIATTAYVDAATGGSGVALDDTPIWTGVNRFNNKVLMSEAEWVQAFRPMVIQQASSSAITDAHLKSYVIKAGGTSGQSITLPDISTLTHGTEIKVYVASTVELTFTSPNTDIYKKAGGSLVNSVSSGDGKNSFIWVDNNGGSPQYVCSR